MVLEASYYHFVMVALVISVHKFLDVYTIGDASVIRKQVLLRSTTMRPTCPQVPEAKRASFMQINDKKKERKINSVSSRSNSPHIFLLLYVNVSQNTSLGYCWIALAFWRHVVASWRLSDSSTKSSIENFSEMNSSWVAL